MNETAKLKFANSFIMSRLNYGNQFYLGENQDVQRKYHKACMTVSRWVKGSFCFKISCQKICSSLKWDLLVQRIRKSSLKMIHKILIMNRPKQITKLIRKPRSRNNVAISIKRKRKHENYDRDVILQALQIYNKMPEDLKNLRPKQITQKLRKMII